MNTMFKTHKFPVQLFLVFENISPAHWTSSASKPNNIFTLWPNESLHVLCKVLQRELALANSFLVEASAVDTSRYTESNESCEYFTKEARYFLFYTFYFYFLSMRITFVAPVISSTFSIEGSYPNANWVERELMEMYGLFFYNKLDARNLLLDYTLMDNPMLKSYPCVGFNEVFYSPLEECVVYYPNTSVEL